MLKEFLWLQLLESNDYILEKSHKVAYIYNMDIEVILAQNIALGT